MLTVTFTNLRTSESINLDDISQNGSGVEAISGATGFGLPPVEVQWFEGAGDGAEYRGTRVTARDLDIPLFVYEENRADLKATLKAFSRIVAAGPFRITLTDTDDADDSRYIDVVRVGGGTYTYGEDTAGETDWPSLVTVRAGNPYWLALSDETISRTYTAVDSFTITNDGTAPAIPVWTFHGPLSRAKVINDDTGESLEWSGSLNLGESLTISAVDATVLDQDDHSRYSGMSPAPSFFNLEAGANSITVEIDKLVLASSTRTNYVTNPTFGNTTHGYTVAGPGTAVVSGGKLKVGDDASVSSYTPTSATATFLLEFNEGENFELRFKLSHDHPAFSMSYPHRVDVFAGGVGLDPDVYLATLSLSNAETPTARELVFPFTVPASGKLVVQVYDGAYNLHGAWRTAATFFDDVYVGLPGAYFDGGTTDTSDVTYAWTGTADASTSTATSGDLDPTASISYRPRDWMVV